MRKFVAKDITLYLDILFACLQWTALMGPVVPMHFSFPAVVSLFAI